MFDDLIKNIQNNKELNEYIWGMLINGEVKNYNLLNNTINLGNIFGYFINDNGQVKLSNKIFEQVLYNYYSSKIEADVEMNNYNFKDNFVTKAGLDKGYLLILIRVKNIKMNK